MILCFFKLCHIYSRFAENVERRCISLELPDFLGSALKFKNESSPVYVLQKACNYEFSHLSS